MDLIDKRNKKEKMASSIIKRRNVIYAMPQQINESEKEGGPEPEKKPATEPEEILEHFREEKRNDEEKWRQEIEHLLEEQEKNQAEINRIMGEKRARMERAVQEAAKNS